MSKAPDLSGFPIPRKGGAKPIVGEETGEGRGERSGPHPSEEGRGEGSGPRPLETPPSEVAASPPRPEPELEPTTPSRAPSASRNEGTASRSARPIAAVRAPSPPPQSYGQMVATTVKLDENRYLRLMEAGKPGPGRLRRRTIQDMLIEALDEWFERRQL
jgi:hypothetical protein